MGGEGFLGPLVCGGFGGCQYSEVLISLRALEDMLGHVYPELILDKGSVGACAPTLVIVFIGGVPSQVKFDLPGWSG